MSPSENGRFSLSARASLVLLGTLIVAGGWSVAARDPDFFLPDPFPPLLLWAVGVFLGAGFVRNARWRTGLRVALGVLPLLLVVAIEWRMSARDVERPSDRIEPTADLLLRYHFKPGARPGTVDADGGEVRINSLGLWDREYAIPKPPGVYRVVVLGDSVPNDGTLAFTQRFPKLLEASLAGAGGRTVEVINVSCEGYNTIQEVRLLETVGLRLQPDVVVLAYVLNDPFLQNGAYRRVGNSYFLFVGSRAIAAAMGESRCRQFAMLHRGYGFDLVVRQSLERLRLLSELHHFDVVVATVPIVAPFDDPECLALYDQVLAIARQQGFEGVRLSDGFLGHSPKELEKPSNPHDITHPNGLGHQLIAAQLSRVLTPRILAAADAGI